MHHGGACLAIPRDDTQEVEAGDSEAQGHPQPYSEFEASLDYARLCLKKKNLKRTLSK